MMQYYARGWNACSTNSPLYHTLQILSYSNKRLVLQIDPCVDYPLTYPKNVSTALTAKYLKKALIHATNIVMVVLQRLAWLLCNIAFFAIMFLCYQ